MSLSRAYILRLMKAGKTELLAMLRTHVANDYTVEADEEADGEADGAADASVFGKLRPDDFFVGVKQGIENMWNELNTRMLYKVTSVGDGTQSVGTNGKCFDGTDQHYAPLVMRTDPYQRNCNVVYANASVHDAPNHMGTTCAVKRVRLLNPLQKGVHAMEYVSLAINDSDTFLEYRPFITKHPQGIDAISFARAGIQMVRTEAGLTFVECNTDLLPNARDDVIALIEARSARTLLYFRGPTVVRMLFGPYKPVPGSFANGHLVHAKNLERSTHPTFDHDLRAIVSVSYGDAPIVPTFNASALPSLDGQVRANLQLVEDTDADDENSAEVCQANVWRYAAWGMCGSPRLWKVFAPRAGKMKRTGEPLGCGFTLFETKEEAASVKQMLDWRASQGCSNMRDNVQMQVHYHDQLVVLLEEHLASQRASVEVWRKYLNRLKCNANARNFAPGGAAYLKHKKRCAAAKAMNAPPVTQHKRQRVGA